MPELLPRVPITIDLNISPFVDGIFVGFVLSTILTGVNILQAWNYARSNDDVWILRALVTILIALDIATTSNNTVLVHTYLIRHFGYFLELTVINSGFLMELLLTVIVVFLVQLFFASRVYLLNSKNYWIPGSIIVASSIALAINLYNVVVGLEDTSIFELLKLKFKLSVILGQAFTTLADGITTVALTLHFMHARSESHVRGTIAVLQKLLGYVVTRGLLVTVSNILYMSLYLFNPIKLYWMPIQLTQAKLYILTLIVMLNARKSYKTSNQNNVITSFDNVHNLSSRTGSSYPIKDPMNMSHPSNWKSSSSTENRNHNGIHSQKVYELSATRGSVPYQ